MPKYIEAVKAAEIISERMSLHIADLADVFSDIPRVDVVEVVRCSECDHFIECGEEGYCIIMMRGMH